MGYSPGVYPLCIIFPTELSEYVFQVDEEAEGLHSSILSTYGMDFAAHGKLGGGANKLTCATSNKPNGPLDSGSLQQGGTNKSSSSSSNETH